MFAIVSHLDLTIPVDEFRASMERDGLSMLSTLLGFLDYYMIKVAHDKAIVVSLWDNETHAHKGAQEFRINWFAKNGAPFLASDYQRSIGEVVIRYRQ